MLSGHQCRNGKETGVSTANLVQSKYKTAGSTAHNVQTCDTSFFLLTQRCMESERDNLQANGRRESVQFYSSKIYLFLSNYAEYRTPRIPTHARTPRIPTHACGIDLGVDNTAAFVSSNGYCLLYKSCAVKAINPWYNKQMAALRFTAMKGHSPEEAAKLGPLHTKRMDALTRKRDLFLKDCLHKVAADIVRFCLNHRIGTIVIGVNKDWKQGCNIGHVNNQNFVQIPLATLWSMIRCKAEQEGLTVLEQEESFTSKVDLTAGDEIPVYKKEHPPYRFSGRRTFRGLYRTHDGQVISADLNGAGNILRKAFPNIFKAADFAFLQDVLVRNYKDLNKRIPVKGIGAA